MKNFLLLLMISTLIFSVSYFSSSANDVNWEEMKQESDAEFEKVFNYCEKNKLKNQNGLTENKLALKSKKLDYPKRKGLILTTPDNVTKLGGVFNLGHAGIMYSYRYTVEATSSGVKKHLNNWKK